MLMTTLKGDLAIRQSITLIRLFKAMREFVKENNLLLNRIDRLEIKQLETDKNFKAIFEKLDENKIPKAALFFAGQMFDAFSLLTKLITEAKDSIILIDNYIDTATLDILAKKKEGVKIKIITSAKGNKLTTQDIKTFTSQYGELETKPSDEFHDRFLILDELKLYHIGASLKDAGKKCFEISLIDDKKYIEELLKRIKEETC